ncbi:DUF1343 domain-containing protein [Flammeovirgaceae bacterium SG7u.111]|nr:DUF1343 domain-containing protein [Flammeovirgaceae bacterium SG7u.132]WPO38456.1 DUF1343 domain-containing protein [Flammeovirgaceae bacterium SG7u.111]
MIRLFQVILLSFVLLGSACSAQKAEKPAQVEVIKEEKPPIEVGAERFGEYLPLLKGKRVALVVNQTSVVGEVHLLDTLLSQGVGVKAVFAPEHGFRGDADAGESVKNSVDSKTGVPVVSIYGKTKKPSEEMLKDIDVVVFDIQDVGVRFYTYISTMHYVMEACAEQGKQFIVLDRPNPNGEYVAGPVLDLEFQSFVGMHPIPVVHGLTVGELAKMINQEKWLENGAQCDLTVIPVANYSHLDSFSLPIKPSPNLPNDQSIRLYPSLCFFEPTSVSIGRGTLFPFQVVGYPDSSFGEFSFTPKSIEGLSKYPKLQDKECFGLDLREVEAKQFNMSYLVDYYEKSKQLGVEFFTNRKFFNLLAGNDKLVKELEEGKTVAEIEQGWEKELETYKGMRKKYLIYPDFE